MKADSGRRVVVADGAAYPPSGAGGGRDDVGGGGPAGGAGGARASGGGCAERERAPQRLFSVSRRNHGTQMFGVTHICAPLLAEHLSFFEIHSMHIELNVGSSSARGGARPPRAKQGNLKWAEPTEKTSSARRRCRRPRVTETRPPSTPPDPAHPSVTVLEPQGRARGAILLQALAHTDPSLLHMLIRCAKPPHSG